MNKKYFLFLSIGTLIVGGLLLMSAKSAIHEIESFILFVISSILITGYGILNRLDKLIENNKKQNFRYNLKLKFNKIISKNFIIKIVLLSVFITNFCYSKENLSDYYSSYIFIKNCNELDSFMNELDACMIELNSCMNELDSLHTKFAYNSEFKN